MHYKIETAKQQGKSELLRLHQEATEGFNPFPYMPAFGIKFPKENCGFDTGEGSSEGAILIVAKLTEPMSGTVVTREVLIAAIKYLPPVPVFQSKYLNVPQVPSPEEKRLRELAQEYHERTELYDRTVCTGPIVRGGIMPATAQERGLINRYANALHAELGREAARLGFDLKQWHNAVTNAAHEMSNTECPSSKDKNQAKACQCDVCSHFPTKELNENREYDLLWNCDGGCGKMLCNKCHATLILKDGRCLVLCKDCLFAWIKGTPGIYEAGRAKELTTEAQRHGKIKG